MAENLIRSMLKGTQHENMEEITWEELNAQEKRECLGSAAVDIDFTLFSSQCLHLLAEPFVNLLLSNVSGTVVMRPYIQKLHGCPFTSILILANSQPWKIGICLTDSEEDEEKLILDDQPCKVSGKRYSNFIMEIAAKLEHEKGKTHPFRQIKTILLNLFSEFEICIFQFGQKQPLESFMQQVQNVSNHVRVFVALGMEMGVEDHFLCVAPEKIALGECFFPMLLSQRAGCIMLPSKHSRKLCPDSHRLVVYSTLHHNRKFYSYLLDLKNIASTDWARQFDSLDIENAASSFISHLRIQMLDKIDSFQRNIHPMLRQAKLRVENYIELKQSAKGAFSNLRIIC
jgi:hypothetical protein